MGLIYTTAQAAGRRREKCKPKKFSSVRKAADSQAPNVDRCIREGYQKYRKDVLSDSTWKDTDHHIENLVFSGGGIKSYAFIGALQALEDCGAYSKIKRLSGSSGGAICAGLMAVGFNPQEIADIFSPDATWLFKDQPMLPLFCLPNVFKKFGIHPAKRVYNYFGIRFKEKVGNADITFKQVYEELGRELIIPVTNLNTRQCEYCHHTTTPDLSIRLAMRMTMSFPVMYQPVNATINGQKGTYLDGGTLDHYPIHVFDGKRYGTGSFPDINQNKSDSAFRNPATLGMYVMSEKATDYHIWKTLFERELPNRPFYVPDSKLARSRLKGKHPLKMENQRRGDKLSCMGSMARAISTRDLAPLLLWPETETDIQIKNFGDFFLAAIETVIVNHRKMLVKPEDIDRTVSINCGHIDTNDYDLEAEDRLFLLRQGYECTRRFLLERNSDETQKNQVQQNQVQQNQVQQNQVQQNQGTETSSSSSISSATEESSSTVDSGYDGSSRIVHRHPDGRVSIETIV